MVKLKNVVAAAIVFVAAGAMASNFRAADQVYVPAAGHIGGSSGTFISDVFISNLTTDPVSVSVIYGSTAAGTQANFNNIIHLAAGERREIVDFFPTVLGLQTGLGQLIFNGCKEGGNCDVNSCPNGATTGVCPDFRNIGLVNASQFSSTTLSVKLFNGLTGAQIGSTATVPLSPLGHTQQNLGAMF